MNPAAGVKLPKIVNRERVTYSAADVQKILQAAADHPYRIGFHLLYSLALRVGEMFGLRWANVELPEQGEGLVHIVEQLSRAEKYNVPACQDTKLKNLSYILLPFLSAYAAIRYC